MRSFKLLLSFTCLLCACTQTSDKPGAYHPIAPPSVIDASLVRNHIRKLSSDEMEGRAPGSHGEELATAYIHDYLKSLGLKTSIHY